MQELPPELVKELGIVLIALIGCVGAGLKWGLPRFLGFLEKKLSEKTKRGVQDIQEVYNIMDEILEDTSADRVIQFVGHNSGGIPRVGAAFYCTAIRWRLKDRPEKKAGIDLSDYFKVPVGNEYIGMLLNAEKNGIYRFTTENEPECQLKGYYKIEGVTDSLIVFLKIKERHFHYMSIATFAEEGLTEEDIMIINLKVARIRQLV